MITEPRILIIDDDARALHTTARFFRAKGWAVGTARSPKGVFSVHEPDIVLSDWDMPDGGGARVLRESDVPVVLCSGSYLTYFDLRQKHPQIAWIEQKPCDLKILEVRMRLMVKALRSVDEATELHDMMDNQGALV